MCSIDSIFPISSLFKLAYLIISVVGLIESSPRICLLRGAGRFYKLDMQCTNGHNITNDNLGNIYSFYASSTALYFILILSSAILFLIDLCIISTCCDPKPGGKYKCYGGYLFFSVIIEIMLIVSISLMYNFEDCWDFYGDLRCDFTGMVYPNPTDSRNVISTGNNMFVLNWLLFALYQVEFLYRLGVVFSDEIHDTCTCECEDDIFEGCYIRMKDCCTCECKIFSECHICTCDNEFCRCGNESDKIYEVTKQHNPLQPIKDSDVIVIPEQKPFGGIHLIV